MNKLDLLKRLFPQSTATFQGRGSHEVNGLPKGTVPQNCQILMSGLAETHSLGRQEHYLVSIDDTLLYLRVCEAMEGSGYDEFAVIFGIATLDEDKQTLTERAQGFIESCCVSQ